MKVIEKPCGCVEKEYNDGQTVYLLCEKHYPEIEQPAAIIQELAYWKKRCGLAEKYIEESPCDPDITSSQIKAWAEYQNFINQK